jgi:hypothetical protein
MRVFRRALREKEHDVRLTLAQHVKPYVKANGPIKVIKPI